MFEPAPYHSDISRGPKGGRAVWAHTSDDVRIRVGLWPITGARGTVLIFPGRTEYIEKYSDAAREFAVRGLASLAIDWRGQGLADRATPDTKLGHVTNFDEYQRDVDAAVAVARDAGLPEPYYLFAHSMGGCIGLRSLMRGLCPTRMKRIPRYAHAKCLKCGHFVIGIQSLGAIFTKTTVKGIAIRKINPRLTGPTYFLHNASPDVFSRWE